ncbi:MAG: hypothetical protein JWO88_3578 [Frankiales bacterium]|nr:hypothetical protein [Frankiales bacterium]
MNLCPTGMIPTKAMTQHVPLTPEEVVTDVLACHRAGLLSSVHLHARDVDGVPTWDPQVYAEMIAGIRAEAPDLVVCASTSGRNFPEFERRSAVLDLPDDLKPDMASLTLSSMNFARTASVNSPDMVAQLALAMRERGIKPELEAFDTGMINYIHYLLDRGVLEPPLYCNVFVGNVATAQMTLLELGVMLGSLPADTVWSVAGLGAAQLTANAMSVAYGGGVRVGLEDNIWFDDARNTPATNQSLAQRIAELAEIHGRAIMSPSDLRKLLELPDR